MLHTNVNTNLFNMMNLINSVKRYLIFLFLIVIQM
jgi:hypothetical protein